MLERRGGAAGSSRSVTVGLVGRGIQSSRTPGMHEAEGARLGIDYAYVLIDFDAEGLSDDDLGAVVRAAEAAGYAGLNVTHPFKQAVMSHLVEIAAEADAIGAVNTVVFSDAGRQGHNTDSWGFARSFRAEMAGCALSKVTLFGAGGAGAAVARALLELGADEITIVDPDTRRAGALAERLSHRTSARIAVTRDAAAAVRASAGIVNATPVGMAKYPGTPFDTSCLSPSHWVADVIYVPQVTELVRRARAMGCRALPGTGMAIGQAVKAFALFTGQEPDPAAMEQHFENAA
jgi:shikimate dehydrogenase